MNVGVVGLGAIGSDLAACLARGEFPGLRLAAVSDMDEARAGTVVSSLPGDVAAMSLDELVAACHLVIEATAKAAMPGIVTRALEKGRWVLALSVGGLADSPDLGELAEKHGGRLYLPSGALAGIDAILAAREAGLTAVSLTTTKNPKSLAGAPYLVKNGISLEGLAEPRVIFEGNAMDAVQGFPANANVAITLSFAGIGMEKTRVRFIADPAATLTRQEIRAEGAVGSIHTVTEGSVAPTNPRSGYLAILSARSLLRKMASPMPIGS